MLKYQNVYGKENKKFWKLVKDDIGRANLPTPTRFDNVVRGWVEKYKQIKNPHRMLSGEEANYAYEAEMKQWIAITEEVAREDTARLRNSQAACGG